MTDDRMKEAIEKLRDRSSNRKEELRELFSNEKEHTDDCPNQPDAGYVCALINCPKCEEYGRHPTRECEHCGYSLCWCVN